MSVDLTYWDRVKDDPIKLRWQLEQHIKMNQQFIDMHRSMPLSDAVRADLESQNVVYQARLDGLFADAPRDTEGREDGSIQNTAAETS